MVCCLSMFFHFLVKCIPRSPACPALFVEGKMVVDECVNEVVAMVIAFLQPELPQQVWVADCQQIVGQQVRGQELVSRALNAQ